MEIHLIIGSHVASDKIVSAHTCPNTANALTKRYNAAIASLERVNELPDGTFSCGSFSVKTISLDPTQTEAPTCGCKPAQPQLIPCEVCGFDTENGGPDEEDGPWAKGWVERSGGTAHIADARELAKSKLLATTCDQCGERMYVPSIPTPQYCCAGQPNSCGCEGLPLNPQLCEKCTG